jgi:2-polyprenyl-3-methyl-5-hydroxy-6-metoxy-1,4-benzoquinol methylase
MDYKELQVKGSDWSYGSAWGDQMVHSLTFWFHPNKNLEDSILDVGCGEGRGVQTLLNLGHKNVYGIDITEEKVNKGKSTGLNLLCADLHDDILGEKKYDYVFTSHALEHMYDLPRVISYLVKATKKEIWFIIPIRETEEFVRINNPSHVWPIDDPKEFTDILDKQNLKYQVIEKTRLSAELHGIIYC